MNQSCWMLDMALMSAKTLNENLQRNEFTHNPEWTIRTNGNLKSLAKRCEKFTEWQNEVQDLLFLFFNLEFQVQSLILCFSIYVLSYTFNNGMILVLFNFCATQIFFLCWMGTRVTSRIEALSLEISKNWYLKTPLQRKTLQMIIHWTQNMKRFTGMFKNVSLETCKSVNNLMLP